MKFFLLSLFLISAACSFKKNELANQTQNGHEELYSEPEAIEVSEEAGIKKIVIAATNDIAGNYGTQAIKIKDSHNKDRLHIEIGGVDFFSSYLRILREKYKSVILVDSGDFLPSDPEDYKHAQDFYSSLKYNAVSPGLTDLSARSSGGSNPIKKFSENSQVTVLASNLYELKTARGIEWKGIDQYQVTEVNGVKVGMIGILPDDISSLTPVDNRIGLYVENMLQSTLHQARRLRSLGAQIIVVMTHQGLDCGSSIAETSRLPLTKVNFEPKKEDSCNLKGPLGTFLQRLPAQLVDVVIAGRNHQKVANIINGVVVLSGFESAKSFSYVELSLDEKSGKVLSGKTVVHQPVMVCREFFKETNDCYTEDPSVNHKERIPAKFLGEQVERNEEMRTKFRKYFDDVSVGTRRPADELLKYYSADIIYSPASGNSTHLVVLKLSGAELSHWLELSYNEEETHLWKPSPFSRSSDDLVLKINGEALMAGKEYRILTNVESLQSRIELWKYISSDKLISLTEESWKGNAAGDEVSMAAASHRQ
ncbi:MAG: hypothetical protein V4598_13430 [Bdellovibrionota bacterium]